MNTEKPIIYIFSGAGLSAESGLATFRDNDGMWRKFDFNVVCNFNTWEENRDAVFDFYVSRRREMLCAKPNQAHVIIAQLQQKFGPDRVKLLTQNGDTLLEQAGALEVCHLHGNISELRCVACNHWFVPVQEYGADVACPLCKKIGKVKPGVAFFNEDCPNYDSVFLFKKHVRPQDIVVVVGTSFNVIDIEKFLPKRRFASERNYQINPRLEYLEWFGNNIEKSASEGFEEIQQELDLLMTDSWSSHLNLRLTAWIKKLKDKTQELKANS